MEAEQKGNHLTKRSEKEDNEDKRCNKSHHFTVLPKGLGARFGGMERWERVDIEGVDDEVGAHLGLFIPVHNLAYEGLVERVRRKIFEWCEDLEL